MPKPENLTNEADAGPDGSIFLPQTTAAERDINKRLSGLYLSRGPDIDLDPNQKHELAMRLLYQKLQLAELAIRAT